jgi:hypothetical protein
MSEPASLEQGYRRLLAWYPTAFRSEQGEEMLAVLMASAQQGQRRPGLMESLDVLRSAVRMRIRSLSAGMRNKEWTDALALFSVAAPLFLLAADILEVVLPYRVPVTARFIPLSQSLGRHPEIGGLSLTRLPFFDIAVGCQVIIAVLVLLGLRWLALGVIAASTGYLAVASQWIDWIPRPLQLLTAAAYLLTAAALIGSPDPRRGRTLLTWGHGAVLLLLAGAAQASTLLYDATGPFMPFFSPSPPNTGIYFMISIVLAVAALIVAVVLRMNRYFLLLLAVMFYPYVMQLAYPASSTSGDLLGHPTPAHLAVLFGPPLLAAVVAVITAAARWRGPLSSGPGQPGVA